MYITLIVGHSITVQFLHFCSPLPSPPSQQPSQETINSFVYDEDMSSLLSIASMKARMESLLKEKETFWQEIIKPFTQEDNLVVMIGKPSKNIRIEQEMAEKKFLAERKLKLGKNGLAEKARLLKEAQEANERNQIPDSLLAKIPIPSVNSIVLPEASTLRSQRLHPEAATTNKKSSKTNITQYINVLDSPYALQISQYESPIVQLQVYAHAGGLEPELKHLLPLYINLIFQTDVQRDDKVVTYEEMDMELSKETQEHSASILSDMGLITITVGVEKDKLQQGLQYLKEGLTQKIFTSERLLNYMTLFNQELQSKLSSWVDMAIYFIQSLLYKKESMSRLNTFISLRKTLDDIKKDVQDNGAQETIDKFKRITEFLTNPKRIFFHIAGDIMAIGEKLKREQRKDLEQVRVLLLLFLLFLLFLLLFFLFLLF